MRGEIENAGYAAFFDALIDGRLKLGQTLTQDELCKVLGLSLSPMRETTTLLEAEGLITFRRKVGNAKDLTRQEANSFIADFVAWLEGYTYLEEDARAE